MLSLPVLGDMLRAFAGQIKRTPWGVALLWISLTVAAAALVIGFGLAEGLRLSLSAGLPGELDRLYYFSAASRVGGGPQGSAQGDGFTVGRLEALIEDGTIEGYFFEIHGKPVMLRGRMLLTTMVVYGGQVPLYGGTATDALVRAAGTPGVAVNRSLAENGFGLATGESLPDPPADPVYLLPDCALPAVVIVGPPARLEPTAVVLAAGRSVSEAGHSHDVALYVRPETDLEKLLSNLRQAMSLEDPGVVVSVASAREELAPRLREARVVSALTTACALVIALVAFVNAGALLSLWIVSRVPGLSLRRALGASPRLVALYVLFDLVVTTLPSTGAGLAAGVLARKWLPLQVGPLVVGAALGLMVTGAILAGLVLTRTVDLVDPGLLLRRGV